MEPEFYCPRCHSLLLHQSETERYCSEDNLTFRRIDGVWRFLLPKDQQHFEQFISDYQTIRRAESRFSDDSDYFQRLPFEDITQQRTADWRIRAISYRMLLEKIVEPHEQDGKTLNILDMGAGNCWLSYRLSERGHSLTAVDLMVNDWDGLGAHRYFPVTFTPVQANYDRLPIANQKYDLIIFNASFHYSEDYVTTLREMLRCLTPAGQIIILDSPLYSDPSSGHQMVSERENQFESAYGLRSNALKSENFLTYDQLGELEEALSIHWKLYRPFYGFRWMLRPILANIRGHRKPAQFVVLAATRRKGSIT